MIDFLELMTRPLAACFIIAGIHVYLGLHVVKRGVIFVDLALAQVSAFGATVGFLVGFDLHSAQSYAIAVAFTLLGAVVFTFTRTHKFEVPQEALIGTVYAVSTAAAILVLSRAPEGGEELKAILVGDLLFVDWPEIIRILILYSVLGAVHWFVRKPLLTISGNPKEAIEQGLSVRKWDFFFYATFGLVVTSAVKIIGVLLVFAFLIVPAVCGVFLARTDGRRLVLGWIVAFVTSLVGIGASFQWDLPTGATVVCAFGVSLLVCAGIRKAFVRT